MISDLQIIQELEQEIGIQLDELNDNLSYDMRIKS